MPVKISKPDWLIEFRRRTALIDVIDTAFSNSCNCEVCIKIREIANELGELFMPKSEKVR